MQIHHPRGQRATWISFLWRNAPVLKTILGNQVAGKVLPWARLSLWKQLTLVWLLFLMVPGAAEAAIQFRAATKHVSETVPLTAAKPAGTTDGDLLIAFVIHDTDPACPCSPPAGQGWTAFSLPGTETDFASRAWYKQVDAADASRTDYTFTFTAGNNSAILYLAAFYEDSGIGNWTLEDDTGWAFDGNANSLSNGGVTAVDNSLFVVAYGNDDNEAVTTNPSGPTKIDEDMAAGAALAAYYEMVDAIDGSVSYSIDWGGDAEQLSAMAGIFSWAPAISANLALTKTDSPDPVVVGNAFVYTLTVTNNGPDTASNVTLVDTLPATIAWQSATPSQGSCVHSGEPLGGTVTCTLGAIANGANATIDIGVDAPNTTGVINNTATVSADEFDPDLSDNAAAEDTTIVNAGGGGPPVCQVDPTGTYIEAENFTGTIVQGTAVFLTESSTPGFNGSGYLRSNGGAATGSPVEEGKIYNIEFTTSGTYNVWMRGYALDNTSDSAFIGLNGTSTGALTEGGTNAWEWTNGIQLGSNQITVPAAGFQDFNTWIREANHQIDGFYLTQGGETPTGGIPPGVATLDPTQCIGANLALTKTDSPDPVSVGNAFTYTLTVTNNGPLDASNVTLVDTLPATVDWQSATPSQGSCVHSGEPLGGTVTCTLGAIANGANATIDIGVDAPNTTGVINNSATVSADEPDPDASDNTAAEDTTVIDPSANLNVTQVEDFDPAGVNLPFIYHVTVTNAGPANATVVTLVDPLDAAVTFVGAVPSQGVCNEAGGVVTCDLGPLANGSIATIDITVTAPATPQTVTNTAVVSAAEPDPDLSDNTWAEDTDVINPPPADLALTKIDTPDPVIAGNPLTYTLTIDNLGPGPATLVQLTDTLPAGTTFVSATPSASCSEAGGIVTCNLGTIAFGASETVTIVVTAPATAGLINNNASVSTVRIDPVPGNDSASADTTVTVVGDADLSLSKSDSPDPVNVAQPLAYSLTVDNLGPDGATDVVLVDTLPATVAFQSAITGQGSCVHSGEPLGGTVTCTLGMIANAANAMVDIIVTAPFSTGSITNNASVSATSNDSNAANDTTSEITTVQNLNVNQLCYLVADAGGGGGGNDLLTRIDTADFNPLTNETNIGIGTGTNSIEAIAWNSTAGVLYGANAGQGGILNTTSGVFTPFASTFGTGNGTFGAVTFSDVDGLTYDATTTILYGVQARGGGGTDVLFQIDKTTGQFIANAFGANIDYVPLPPIAGNDITDDIAVDPTTGIMYATVNNGGSTDRLITINKATGATTNIALITVPDIEGLGTDPTGQLWGTSGTQNRLYEINKVSGVGSNARIIDNGGDYESVDCFAFSPSVIADLNVGKTVNDATPREGDTITYTVTVTNNGPSIATVVQLSDVLPAGVTFVSAAPTQGAYDSSTGAWFVGTISAGLTATLNIQASVDTGTATTTISNTASVTFASQFDPNTANNTDSVDIVPTGIPAILITKTVATFEDPVNLLVNPKAIPGATVVYTISVANIGNGDADVDSVVITEPIPAETPLRVLDFDGTHAGPVAFDDGTPSSGLGYTFGGLGDAGDDIEFSQDGSDYTWTPVADANGVDTTVTHMRINLKGIFLFDSPGNPNFTVMFKAIVQ